MNKQGRNDPCKCGSGKKYKKCCIFKENQRFIELKEDEKLGESRVQDADNLLKNYSFL